MKNLFAFTSLLALSLASTAYGQTASSASPNAQTYGSEPPNIGTYQSGDKSIPYNMEPAGPKSDATGSTSGSGSTADLWRNRSYDEPERGARRPERYL
jgi:hypothetical protein